MQFRHEVKHEINSLDMLVLRQRLRAVMKHDEHTLNGIYEIRSLYFDNIYDKALNEKIMGVNIREKYRIRIYNNDRSVIRLERKFKHGNLGYKDTAYLSEEEAEAIVCGDIDWMAKSPNKTVFSFYTKIKTEGLEPKVIVDYTREPFIFDAGNVRVTLDSNIRTGLKCTDFLNPCCVTIPVKDSPNILEVKWDGFLPDIIRDAIQLDNRRNGAYSKYAASRMYD